MGFICSSSLWRFISRLCRSLYRTFLTQHWSSALPLRLYGTTFLCSCSPSKFDIGIHTYDQSDLSLVYVNLGNFDYLTPAGCGDEASLFPSNIEDQVLTKRLSPSSYIDSELLQRTHRGQLNARTSAQLYGEFVPRVVHVLLHAQHNEIVLHSFGRLIHLVLKLVHARFWCI